VVRALLKERSMAFDRVFDDFVVARFAVARADPSRPP